MLLLAEQSLMGNSLIQENVHQPMAAGRHSKPILNTLPSLLKVLPCLQNKRKPLNSSLLDPSMRTKQAIKMIYLSISCPQNPSDSRPGVVTPQDHPRALEAVAQWYDTGGVQPQLVPIHCCKHLLPHPLMTGGCHWAHITLTTTS